ncbi:hypothetical protein [Methylobacterium frigidaeris]|uniref:Uncharacterized protein n=1 Tax=Methylobacterium frigidaeris TaxID=2038277 RepID=A0AA37H730_9HYPH|nr:hypothetical protein [Methylobacterium frigidaeris]PIK73037.1 hypothetical protein CS379_10645 [Methylobacterium frigidaeris]GJD60485.1 hypothetical protein MPEAHAMD_0623 [Methylobacterium frigidaeris]
MTELLRQALAALQAMPPEEQDDLARALLAYTHDGEPDDIEPEHLDAVLDGMAQATRGEFAEGDAHDIVKAAFSRARR